MVQFFLTHMVRSSDELGKCSQWL